MLRHLATVSGHLRGRASANYLLPIALALAASGCGGTARHHQPVVLVSPAAPDARASNPRPDLADYQTIKIARAVRDKALFHEPDPQRKSHGASLALHTLLTVRMAAGPCVRYVGQLYGTLLSLVDAHRGEDWRPLIRIVRREPRLAHVCRPRPQPAGRGPQTQAGAL
jgi:hypothetical protein